MATNAIGVEVPAGTDVFDPQGDMVDLADSLEGRVILPVANSAARDALAAALSPSATEPLIVRYSSGLIQSTTDGTTWVNHSQAATSSTLTTTANWTGNLDYATSPGMTVTVTGQIVRVGLASSVTATVVASGGVPTHLRPWTAVYGRAYSVGNGRSYHATITTAGLISVIANTVSGDLTDGSTVQFSFPAYPIVPA